LFQQINFQKVAVNSSKEKKGYILKKKTKGASLMEDAIHCHEGDYQMPASFKEPLNTIYALQTDMITRFLSADTNPVLCHH
jgi:hypothetical protein